MGQNSFVENTKLLHNNVTHNMCAIGAQAYAKTEGTFVQDIFDSSHKVATEGKQMASSGMSTVSDGLWNMGSVVKSAGTDIY
jgi:hypothetical protein